MSAYLPIWSLARLSVSISNVAVICHSTGNHVERQFWVEALRRYAILIAVEHAWGAIVRAILGGMKRPLPVAGDGR